MNYASLELRQISLDFLIKIWNEGNYDGILGFSQGAWVIRLALFYLRDGKIKANYMPKFIINTGLPGYGYRPATGIISIPSIIMGGEDDYQVSACKEWTARYTDPTLIIHPGGHHPPRELSPAHVTYIRSFLNRFLPRPSL